MSVYQQVLDLSAEGERTLARVLGGDLIEVGLMLSGRSPSSAVARANRHSGLRRRVDATNRTTLETRKARLGGPFEEADEGTRTLDLLHGKRNGAPA